MEDQNRQRDDSIGQIVDEICDAFEVAWKACKTKDGSVPAIEDFLASRAGLQPESAEYTRLVGELIAIDAAYREQLEQSIPMEEYIERFPQAAQEIRRHLEDITKTKLHDSSEMYERQRPVLESIQASAEYDEIRFHAEGGLGEVYRGFDRKLHREVAVKCVHLEHLTNREIRERFRIEAEVTSRLDHPGIVPVYTMGDDALGRPFYVMRFIEGRTLRSAIDDFHATDWRERGGRSSWRLELHRLLRHLIDACNAVAYAHNRGVIHRDIKPENIMIGKFGETLLVDWGLAQFVERDARAKASGEKTLFADYSSERPDNSGTSGTGAGTIGYISPEQIPGAVLPVGPRSDIYSLGATLYKLLTGTTPFHRGAENHVWDDIRSGKFPRPREVSPNCPAALEAICLKAMAVQSSSRYESAEQFAADLDRWMADEPVAVYREPLVERFLRRARRHRAGVIAAGVGTAFILIVAIVSSIVFGRMAESEASLRVHAEDAQKEAEDSRAAAEEARLAHLQSTAVFAAKAIGYEIDQRWRILQRLAKNAELRKYLVTEENATGNPQANASARNQLRDWLFSQAEKSVEFEQAKSWFIVNRQGVQVARYPQKDTIGKPFYHRSYFHAGPHNLPKTTLFEEVKPITGPKISSVYLSSGTTNDFKVAFSVPIYDDNQQFLGVLGMSVELGQFTQLPERRKRMAIALADLRSDQLEGKSQAGLILDHPSFKETPSDDVSMPLVRLPQSVLAKLEAKRQAWHAAKQKHPGSTIRPILIESFDDPAAPEASKGHSAALQCVSLPFSVSTDPTSKADRDVGWVVIIQDREK